MRKIGIQVGAIVALAGMLAGCSPPQSPTPASSVATSAPAVAATVSAAAATAPAATQCTAFAQVYNSQVGPVLKGTGAKGNVYFTQITDAFDALIATVSGATDPYSQTITSDAKAVAADPSSLTALGTFNTDLQQYLQACGMSSS